MSSDTTVVDVDGRPVKLSNLTKPLYPDGFTKGQVIDYYAKIAPMLLPHLADRPATFIRYPDGTETKGFFAKHAPAGRPDWVRTATVTSRSSGKPIDYVIVDSLATLIWAANQAAIEIHVPQWRVTDPGRADLLVLDLDPGAPADILDCARLALIARDLLRDAGLTVSAKTSGSKGLHLYAPLSGATVDQSKALAHSIATHLEQQHPDLAISSMGKAKREGLVFVDWSQNAAAKTTIAAYSLRARDVPRVSTPVTWDELETCDHPEQLAFGPAQVVARVAEHGDLLAGL